MNPSLFRRRSVGPVNRVRARRDESAPRGPSPPPPSLFSRGGARIREAVGRSEDLPLVSVIIPAYNAESYIGRTIESALQQTYRALEVLVVDDGSSDDTARVVEEFAQRDPRVRLFRQENKGVVEARNFAISQARGVYIAPLDADDLWNPEKIAAQVEAMEKGGSKVGLVYTWWFNVDDDGVPFYDTHPWSVEGEAYEQLLSLNFIGNASVPLFRRTCLEEVGGYDPETEQMCEDWDLTLRIADRFHIALVPSYLVGYRYVKGSASSDCRKMNYAHEMVIERSRRRRPEVPERVYEWSASHFHRYLARLSYRNRRYREAIQWFAKAFVRRPGAVLSPWRVAGTLHQLRGVCSAGSIHPAPDPFSGRTARHSARPARPAVLVRRAEVVGSEVL